MNPFLILALGLFFLVADRLAGGDYVGAWRGFLAGALASTNWPAGVRQLLLGVLNVRAVAWATVALAAGLALLGIATPYGARLSLLALGFAGWRWDGWGAFGGAMDPRGTAATVGLFERHLLGVPAFMVAVGLMTLSPFAVLAVAGAMVLFAIFATGLGMVLAMTEGPGFDVNSIIEPARGFGLGILIGLALHLVV